MDAWMYKFLVNSSALTLNSQSQTQVRIEEKEDRKEKPNSIIIDFSNAFRLLRFHACSHLINKKLNST